MLKYLNSFVIYSFEICCVVFVFLIVILFLESPNPVFIPESFSSEILAEFGPPCSNTSTREILEDCFDFGFATAPAHVEDDLDDAWLTFAMQIDKEKENNGPVRAFHNQHAPGDRLRFWSEPDIEIDLASRSGVSAFRMGVDWGRLVPYEPTSGTLDVFDRDASSHYKWIMKKIKDKNMKIMLTLFHHSLPKWASAIGGWTNKKTISYFSEFTSLALEEFNEYVDYWITFNEPTIFVPLTYCQGYWPPGDEKGIIDNAMCVFPFFGNFHIAMNNIAEAHILSYSILKQRSHSPIGIAHHVPFFKPFSIIDSLSILLSNRMLTFQIIDKIIHSLDFCGINYYGQELVSFSGLVMMETEEYSEAGRGIYPNGLFHILSSFHDRYKTLNPKLHYIITENGIADSTDALRKPYLIEHLLSIYAAIKKGVPVSAYFHWTISDNWEWADGYCPKFGMVAVDRAQNLARTIRPSFVLYSQVIKSRKILKQQRENVWNEFQEKVEKEELRTFCRFVSPRNRMAFESLDESEWRVISKKDWRFGHYNEFTMMGSCIRSSYIFSELWDFLSNKMGTKKRDDPISVEL